MKVRSVSFGLLFTGIRLGLCQSTCDAACAELEKLLPSSHVSSDNKDPYWAQQINEIQPACYVRPHHVRGVAAVVRIAVKHECPFAVRGGGHSDVAGASNLAGGITLDLAAFKEVALSKDRTVTKIGPGLDWGTVYDTLDAKNVTVIGGRETTVGVAGLTLGGGISYFSGLYGFACDNVKNYQVVLADGQVVDANASSQYKDLYRALRGGGNNFGVVTRFDLDTYAYNLLEGGLNIYNDSAAVTKAQVEAFEKFAHNAPSDPHAALFTSLDYLGDGQYSWVNGYYYTKPESTSTVGIYRPYYTKLLNESLIESTERTATHGNLAMELGTTQPSGFRQQFHTATFQVNSTLMTMMFQIFREETRRIQKSGEMFSTNMAFQPITKTILEQQMKRGGNVLGLGVPEAPLMLLSMSWPWNKTADDDLVIGGMNRVVSRSIKAAEGMGLFNRFIYMNYAAPGEAVVASYGEQNNEFMKQVSAKYDPRGVFQKLVPGGFKLEA